MLLPDRKLNSFKASRSDLPPVLYAVRKLHQSQKSVTQQGGESPFFVFLAGSDSFERWVHGCLSSVAPCVIDAKGQQSVVGGLAETIQRCCTPKPGDHFFHQPSSEPFPETYSPKTNLYPPMADFLAAHAASLLAAVPPVEDAFQRDLPVGILSNEWPLDLAAYLRFIFPNGKFLFLHQDPVELVDDIIDQAGSEPPSWLEQTLEHWMCRVVSFSSLNASDQVHTGDFGSLVSDKKHKQKVAKLLGFQTPWSFKEFNDKSSRTDQLDRLVTQSSTWGRFVRISRGLGYSLPREISTRIEITQNHSVDTTGADKKEENVEQTRSRCVIMVPSLNQPLPQCESLLNRLESMGYCVYREYGIPSIDVARNVMITRALEENFEEFLWIDDDTVFSLDVIDKIRRHHLPLVGGLVAKKASRSFASMLSRSGSGLKLGAGGGLVEVVQVGTGFLLTHRCVYDAIREKNHLAECVEKNGYRCIPYFLPHIQEVSDGHWYLAEDYSFVEQAKQCGFTPMVDTELRIGHLGLYDYGWEDVAFGRKKVKSLTYDP